MAQIILTQQVVYGLIEAINFNENIEDNNIF